MDIEKVTFYDDRTGFLEDFLGVCDRADGYEWKESDIYGKWKNVRLLAVDGHSYGWLPLGNEIGRTITITETEVIDSKDIRQAEEELTTTFDKEIVSMEMTIPEDWVEIQLRHNQRHE